MFPQLINMFVNSRQSAQFQQDGISTTIPAIMALQTDIFLNIDLETNVNAYQAQQLYIVLQAMLEDIPNTAPLLTVAGWLWDRREHRLVGHPAFVNIVDPRIPFSLDLIDMSCGVYRSGVFPSVSMLDTWHNLSKITDRSPHDPRLYGVSRPTPEQAIEYSTNYLEQVFGIRPIFELQAHHGSEVNDTHFQIWAIPPHTDPMFIGKATYRIGNDGTINFIHARFNF